MKKNKERFERSSNYIKLTTDQIQQLVKPYLNGTVSDISILGDGFANTNYHFSVNKGATSYVLRLSQRNLEQFKKEIEVLHFVMNRIPVPKVIATNYSCETPFAILEYTEGILFSSALESADEHSNCKMSFSIGHILSVIHSFDMGGSGFFNDKFEFTERFNNFGKAYFDYMIKCLELKHVTERMGSELHKKINDLIEHNMDMLTSLSGAERLIHCDFNGKNIVMSNNKVRAVLDWEFASAGHPLVDIGNFLRFEEDYTESIINSFVEGYKSELGELPQGWREIAKLLDLAAMFTFISLQPERPIVSKTALTVFEKTAKFFKSSSR